ncbi:hypothetical protein Q8A73_007390 [Channa argus]|nr:hypothetical protein Q8A73_007390 [Channa argus]
MDFMPVQWGDDAAACKTRLWAALQGVGLIHSDSDILGCLWGKTRTVALSSFARTLTPPPHKVLPHRPLLPPPAGPICGALMKLGLGLILRISGDRCGSLQAAAWAAACRGSLDTLVTFESVPWPPHLIPVVAPGPRTEAARTVPVIHEGDLTRFCVNLLICFPVNLEDSKVRAEQKCPSGLRFQEASDGKRKSSIYVGADPLGDSQNSNSALFSHRHRKIEQKPENCGENTSAAASPAGNK